MRGRARPGRARLPGVPAGPDPAPSEDVPPIGEALEHAHYPTSFETRDAALRRLALDELLALQLGMVARRRARGRGTHAGRRRVDAAADGRIRSALEASLARKLGEPASLTGDQATAIDEIRDDLARPVPMLRLVQGDVGSGKTAVAAWALGGRGPRRAAGGAARPDGPAGPPAPRDADLAARGPRPADHAAHGLAVRRGPAERDARRWRRGRPRSWSGRTRCSRSRGVRRPRAGRRRRAAPVRRRAARGARGEGDARARRTSC